MFKSIPTTLSGKAATLCAADLGQTQSSMANTKLCTQVAVDGSSVLPVSAPVVASVVMVAVAIHQTTP